MKTNVVVVCPWFYRGDAVGAAARETFIHLDATPDFEVSALWAVNDYDDVRGGKVEGLADMLLDPIFLSADVLIYVFAVYHPLFDALLIGNGRARQIVRFHNVTPKALMPEKHWPVIERSFVQMNNFRYADEIWADSQENSEELERRGLGGARTRIEPLAVRFPQRVMLEAKSSETLNLLYVGRFFRSKGVLDLIEVAARLKHGLDVSFRLRLIGNVRFSDPDYIGEIHRAVEAEALGDVVEFVGSVPDEELARAYAESHIFITGSRHEGFCVPVIEGLAAGCIPVSYAVSNLRFIGNSLGRLARTHAPEALSDLVMDMARTSFGQLPSVGPVINVDAGSFTPAQFDSAVTAYVEQFTPENFGQRIRSRVRDLAVVSRSEPGLRPSWTQ
jgi:glycosyltransferase involved in cell wall biosynthesis